MGIKNVRDICACMGAIMILVVVTILIVAIVLMITSIIRDVIVRLKRRYKYKHRFGKPPLAKCYCRDCKHGYLDPEYDDIRHCSTHVDWCVADCWFCWDAEPREKE